METQEDLTVPQKEMIAGLLASPAYLLMLEVLKKEVSALEARMENAEEDIAALRFLNAWKVIRWVHNLLRSQPQRFSEEIRDYLDARKEAMGGEYFPDPRVQANHQPMQGELPWSPNDEN